MILNSVRVNNGSSALCIIDEQHRAYDRTLGNTRSDWYRGCLTTLGGKYLRTIGEVQISHPSCTSVGYTHMDSCCKAGHTYML